MERCIVYLRRSSNREDRQTISLESQWDTCKTWTERKGFEIVEIIEESHSARDENKRPGFHKMLKLCRKGKADYVMAYDATRISRNTQDSSAFLDLIEKGYIKGLITTDTGQIFDDSDTSSLMLNLNLIFSRSENRQRAKSVKSRMLTLYDKGQIMTKTPFGYDRVKYVNSFQEVKSRIVIDKEKKELVKIAFQLRLEGKTTPEISGYFKNKGFKLEPSGIDKILKNSFYCGIMDTKFGISKINPAINEGYEKFISEELFEKINEIKRPKKREQNVKFPAYFKGLVFDEDDIPFTAYYTKNKYGEEYTYYRAQNRSRYTINVSEEKLFEICSEYIKQFDRLTEKEISLIKRVFEAKLNEGKKKASHKIGEIGAKITKCEDDIKTKRSKLGYDDDMDRQLSLAIKDQEENLKSLRLEKVKAETAHGDFEGTVKKLVKLLGSLYQCYERESREDKARILRALQVKLYFGPSGFLYTKEDPAFGMLGLLGDLSYGSATENRTPVCGMKTRRPDH